MSLSIRSLHAQYLASICSRVERVVAIGETRGYRAGFPVSVSILDVCYEITSIRGRRPGAFGL